MNMQEAFDKVWERFVVEGRPASVRVVNGTKRCKYRGPRGARCAVGLLISGDEYRPEMEGKSAGELVEAFDPPSLRALDCNFLEDLQNAHDDAATWPSYKKGRGFRDRIAHRLRTVAETYGIEVKW